MSSPASTTAPRPRPDGFIAVDNLPPGLPAMSLPIKPERRAKQGEIRLRPATAEDMETITASLHIVFPPAVWDVIEPIPRRPSPSVRAARLAKHFRHSLKEPQMHWIVAEETSTGAFAGVAGWHLSGADGKYFPPVWPRRTATRRGWYDEEGYGEAEVAEMWEAVDVEAWEKVFAGYDDVREEIMGGELHWFLAPLIVLEKFRGRGVGTMLLEWASKQADMQDPPTPCYLEALPNARPVYLHHGYKEIEGDGIRKEVLIRRFAERPLKIEKS